MAEQSAFLTAFDEMQKKKGGFNAPLPVAPGFKPQLPQELSAPQVGPTLANEAQLPVEQRTQDGTMIGVPDFNEPYIVPEAAQAFGDVPVNMPSNPLDPNAQISAVQDRLPSAPSEVDSRGFLEKFADATRSDPAPQVGGGISPFGGGTAMRTKAEGASGGVVDAIQSAIPMGLPGALPFEGTPSPATPAVVSDDPFGVTPEEIAAAGNENLGKAVAENPYRSQYGVNSLEQGAVDEIQQQDAAAPQAQAPQGLNSTQAMLQERFGSPTISGIQSAEEGLGLRTDAQGRMIDPNVDRSSFEQASADREARQADRPDFGEAVSDRDRRAARGEGISDADRRDIAKANQRGASAGDVSRGDKVAEANGIDRKTGKPLEGDGLTFDQQLKLRSQKFNEGKFEYEATKDAKELYDASLTEAKEAKTAEAKAESVGKGLASSVADMRDVMGRASGRLDGFFSTDMVGKAASFWKGSDADAQEADFAFLKSNVALNAMMELKANSPTGSTGFGALNTEELKVLTNQFATLDPFTDSKLVRQNLKQLNERFEGIIQNAYNTHAAKYGKEAADGVYGSMVGGKQAQGQSNQAPSGKSVTTPNGKFTATAVID